MTRPTNMSATPTVLQAGQMNFEGNITPHAWYKQLTLPNGKPYLNAIIILAEIVYWYRPSEDRDEATGKLRGYKRKFWGNLLQRTYDSFADQFSLSKGQCQDAIKYLEDQGLITRVFRNIKTETGLPLNNVLYIDLHVDRLKEVTYPDSQEPLSGSEDTPPLIEGDTPLDETPDITENTSENTSEIPPKITHHHQSSDQANGGGATRDQKKEADAQQKTMEGEDRAAKEELALELIGSVAPNYNNAKSFMRNLSDDQLDGLGAWLMLLKKENARKKELKNVPGYLQTQVLSRQYPEEEYAWRLWNKGVEIYKNRPKDQYFDWGNDLYKKLGLY